MRMPPNESARKVRTKYAHNVGHFLRKKQSQHVRRKYAESEHVTRCLPAHSPAHTVEGIN